MKRRIFLTAPLLVSVCRGQESYQAERKNMIRQQIESRNVQNRAVLRVMEATPRHRFVPESLKGSAYEDRPLPIGFGQTISQPYIVAAMTELLDVKPEHRVLEIGTGSGYQAAILTQLSKQVFSIEIVPELAKSSAKLLDELGYKNVTVRHGDGYKGWPEEAPFDRIILTAAPPEIPPALIQQLTPGGILVAPEGPTPLSQELFVIRKDKDGKTTRRTVFPVRFVPMTKGVN